MIPPRPFANCAFNIESPSRYNSRSRGESPVMTARVLALSLRLVASAVAAADPSATLVIEHVDVFDAEMAKMLPDRTIVMAGERILSVGEAATAPDVPPSVKRFDGRGKYAIPG